LLCRHVPVPLRDSRRVQAPDYTAPASRLGFSDEFDFPIVTGTNRAVVRFYNQRGTAEQWIKEGKASMHWTRHSCHRFLANEVRLVL
jgi:hypothetical protein